MHVVFWQCTTLILSCAYYTSFYLTCFADSLIHWNDTVQLIKILPLCIQDGHVAYKQNCLEVID